MTTLRLGGTTDALLGAHLLELTQHLSAPRAPRAALGMPGRLGTRLASSSGAAAREITLGVYFGPDTLQLLPDRPARIARLESALAGRLPLWTVDRPLVRTWVVCTRVTVGPVPGAPVLGTAVLDAVITLLALDGGSEDMEPSALALGTARTAVAVGTLPTHATLWWSGGTSPRTLTETDGRGRTIGVLSSTATLAAGASLVVDLDRKRAWVQLADGTRTVADGTLTGTWPALDPDDAVGLGLLDGTSDTLAPGLSLSSGTGLLITRRRWRL